MQIIMYQKTVRTPSNASIKMDIMHQFTENALSMLMQIEIRDLRTRKIHHFACLGGGRVLA